VAFREFESACEQSPTCVHMSGISRVRCVRECISPSCYQDIYQSDQVRKPHILGVTGHCCDLDGYTWT
jgi:hypothetical protein